MKIKQLIQRIIKLLASARIITIVILITFLISIGFLSLFLYKNFYQTITQSQEIVVLRAEVSPYTINVEKFRTALTALDKKFSAPDKINWAEIKNPFTANLPNKQTIQGID
ncbi:MAG: hypothetical protein WC508_00040 [Patescibacteria group bacterium]